MIHAAIYTWNIASIRGQNVGAYDNHVLVLINGRPLREGISGGHNNLFYNAFPAEGIERIEIIRGPGSVLYGTNAFSGVINIITRKAVEETNFQTSISYGSFNTKAVNFGGGVHINKDLNINIGGRWFDDDGSDFGGVYDASTKKPDGSVAGSVQKNVNWTKDNKSIFVNMNYKSISLTAGYGDIYPFALAPPVKWEYGNIKAGEEIAMMKHYFSDLGYSYEFNDKYSLNANLTFNGREWIGKIGTETDQTKAISNNVLAEISFQASPIDKLNFIIGGFYNSNAYKGKFFMEDGQLINMNAYLQVDYKLFNKVKLIAGGQVNMPQGFQANISPRAGIIYNINEKFGIKALHSNAFRSPYPQETSIQHPRYTGNKDLTPEIISTKEIQAFYQNKKLHLALTYYISNMTNLINKMPDTSFHGEGMSRFVFVNVGEFDFTGIEFEGKYSINDKLSLFTNMTYQENEGRTNNMAIKNAAAWPNFMAKAGLMYSGEKLSGGIFNSYFGKPTQVSYLREEMGEKPIEELNPEATAYNLLTLNVNMHLFKLFGYESERDLVFGIYGDNLLNESIWFPEFIRREVNTLPLHTGRAFYGKLAFKF
jgi:outer membrane receptor for ferrienterochelin and colicin